MGIQQVGSNNTQQMNGCPQCNGTKVIAGGTICPTCLGTGHQKVPYQVDFVDNTAMANAGSICENRADKTPIGESKRANVPGDKTVSAV